MPCSRRHLLVACLLPLGGCAALLGPPTVRLSQDELQARVQQHFPLQRRVLDLFDVSLLNPRLTLLPERKRLAAVMDLQARERVLSGTWRGQIAFDAELRWNGADQTLSLFQVRVHDLALQDPSSPVRNVAERLGAALAERALEGLVLYKLSPERWLELQRRGVEPGEVAITPRGVEIVFVPLMK